MPLWSATGTIKAAMRGVPVTVLDGEVLSDGQKSIAIALPLRLGNRGVGLSISFASTPTTVDYKLESAMNNVDTDYIALANINNVNGASTYVNWVGARYVRVHAVDADVEAVTASIAFF